MNDQDVERNLPEFPGSEAVGDGQRPGARESFFMAFVAVVFFISWGVYINWDFGTEAIIVVAVQQGVISFVATFLSSDALQRLYWAIKRFGWHGLINVPLGFSLLNGIIFLAHCPAGTPRILPTMAPGLIISVFFCSAYTYRLSLAFAKRHGC